MKKMIFAALSLAAGAFLLVFSNEARNAVSGSVSDCLEIIIPSLFAFSALAIYLQKSGLYTVVFKPLAFVLSKILKTDEEICCVFLLSNIGGYPVGASLIRALTDEKRLCEKDAQRLLCCCFGSGPSFIVGVVGNVVFNSSAAGFALFAACFLSSFIMALFFARKITLQSRPAKFDLGAGCFISSVGAAAKAMFSVCTMIVVFSVIMAELKQIGAFEAAKKIFAVFGENAQTVFSALLEVTRIKEFSAGEGVFPVCAGLLSFGGVCVALQLSAIVGGKIPLGKFLLSRIPAAAISAAFAYVFVCFTPEIAEQTLAGNVLTRAFSGSAPLSVCLLAMSALLLLGEKRRV